MHSRLFLLVVDSTPTPNSPSPFPLPQLRLITLLNSPTTLTLQACTVVSITTPQRPRLLLQSATSTIGILGRYAERFISPFLVKLRSLTHLLPLPLSPQYLGHIPESSTTTYNVVGNCNEVGLCIGETTFGGLEDLCEAYPGSIVDYGSLIWITLQRSATAREAIATMDHLMQTYGYASEGESFSIADADEVWINEVIGKGKHELGSVWAAVRIPDGAVSSHANQARITTFDWESPDVMYSADVLSFAKKIGLLDGAVGNRDFSFSDTYDPVTFEGARFCEGRVWR